jgi:hypothetical protein
MHDEHRDEQDDRTDDEVRADVLRAIFDPPRPTVSVPPEVKAGADPYDYPF